MSQDVERVYTINLGKVLLSANNRRATRAINMIREFARHHMKTQEVKIDEELSHQIWARGIKHPPRKVRVRMSKTDEGYVLISRYEEELEPKAKPTPEKPAKVEEKPAQVEEIPAEVEEKPKEVAKEKPKEVAKEKPKEVAKEKPKEVAKKPKKETSAKSKKEKPTKSKKEKSN